MASKSNKYFGNSSGDINLRDFDHASKLFVDNDHRLAPKVKFLYHVRFNINDNAIVMSNMGFKPRHQNEINMLVKDAELPKFVVQTDTLNQYNRKKNTQVKIDYQPVTITFHDDNAGVTRQLWESYYKYYYADPTSATRLGAYSRNATKSGAYTRTLYGLDNNSYPMFFNDITIYQMGRGYWNSYTLINPIIQSWNHSSLDYSTSQPAEQSMTLIYEAVAYNNGIVYQGNPPGFGIEHYDTRPSPYGLGGNARRVAGAIDGATSVFGAIADGTATGSPLGVLSTAVTAVNTYQNLKSLGNQKLSTLDTVSGVLAAATAISNRAVSGVQNVAFPVANAVRTVQATARSITTAAQNLRNLF